MTQVYERMTLTQLKAALHYAQMFHALMGEKLAEDTNNLDVLIEGEISNLEQAIAQRELNH